MMPSATPKMEKSVARSGIEKDANRIETGGRDRRDVKTRSGCGGTRVLAILSAISGPQL